MEIKLTHKTKDPRDLIFKDEDAFKNGSEDEVCYISHYSLTYLYAERYMTTGSPFADRCYPLMEDQPYELYDRFILELIEDETIWTKRSIKAAVKRTLDDYMSSHSGWDYTEKTVDDIADFVFENLTWEDVTTLLKRVNLIYFLTGDKTLVKLHNSYL